LESDLLQPLKRTLQTAEALDESINLKIELRDGLKEINYGKWEGMSVEDVSREYHDDHIKWLSDPGWNPPTGGEPQ
jgi:probable phosphoglycerate mutase